MNLLGKEQEGAVEDSSVGSLLREWREKRRLSQLALSLDAGVSARHLSFLETGRSRPSRAMIATLAEALDIPLRIRNDLLLAAGFAPLYRESSLELLGSVHVRRAIELILTKQEPYPAVVMDRRWNLLTANRAAELFFGRLIDLTTVAPPWNILRLMFDPHGLRPYVVDWEGTARALVGRARREALCGVVDSELQALLDELAEPGAPPRPSLPEAPGSELPVLPVEFEKSGVRERYFSTITTLGTPQDVTLQELRIECFFPADEATAELAASRA